MEFNRLKAKFFLAIGFFIHLFRRVVFFWKKPRGLNAFFSQYSYDGILPVTPGERSLFPSFEKCMACSLCTFSCTSILEGKAPMAFEPKFILLGLGRSSHESEIFLEEWLPCIECGSCTVLCPNNVPVHAMATEIIDRRSRLGFRSN